MKWLNKIIDKNLLSIDDVKGRLSVLGLALPLFIENVGMHLIGVIRSSMSANYASGYLVEATTIANNLASPFATVLTLMSTGMAIILSIYLGKRKTQECGEIIGTATIGLFLMTAICSAILAIFAKPLLGFVGLGELTIDKQSVCITYFRYHMIDLTCQFWLRALTAALRVYGYTKIGMICTFVTSTVSASVQAILMYWIKIPLSVAPEWIYICAPAVSNMAYIAIVVIVFKIKKLPFDFRISFKWLKNIFKIGAPATIAAISYTISSTITGSVCASFLGTSALLAKSYVSQLVYFVYLFGWSIGQANSIMVGRICGMGDLDKADKMHRQNMRIVIFSNFVFSLIFAVGGPTLIKYMFTQSMPNGPEILALSTSIVWIDIIVELGRGMNHMGQYGLNATGDVRYTTVVSILSCWAFAVGLGTALMFLFKNCFGWANAGLIAFWLGFAVDEVFRGVLYFVRWIKGGWRLSFEREINSIEKFDKSEVKA